MIIFRFFLVVVLVSMSIYTAVVIDQHGMGLFGVFFGDEKQFGWAQFCFYGHAGNVRYLGSVEE